MKIINEAKTLGITNDMIIRKKIQRFYEPEKLVEIEGKMPERIYQLEPITAMKWMSMKNDALRDGIMIYAISTFRSYAYQADIIRRKIEKGIELEKILEISAPPGFSEHHSGRAIDIGTPEFIDLDESFQYSEAYTWLQQNASRYGFHMSFPKGNKYGYGYEPWHWLHNV